MFTLKEDCTYKDFGKLQPTLFILFSALLTFAHRRDLPVVVTSIISDRGNTRSKSTTHEEGRAIDVSVNGWSEKQIEEVQQVLRYQHENIAAISASTMLPSPVVYHNYMNQGSHLHLQVRRS